MKVVVDTRPNAVASLNRAVRAARNELTSLVDSLRVSDIADTHGVSEEEADKAIELLRGLIGKL